jgi:2-polyprenyl-3-methyl-5-hydroxy-6-metoxy-1,4-benzoquinol methylase
MLAAEKQRSARGCPEIRDTSVLSDWGLRHALHSNAPILSTSFTAESFDSRGERFDSIVFNEMLYYADDPIGLLKRYAFLLREGGVILCSIYQKPGTNSLRSRLLHYLDRRRPI